MGLVARGAMPRQRKAERSEERSLRASDAEYDSDSDDGEAPLRYDRQFDHPDAVAITGHGQGADAVTKYTIEVYSGDPPTMKWELEKRYSEVDTFRKDLATAKGWKKDLEEYEFPLKVFGQMDEQAQRDRQTKLETWLNSVLALAAKKRVKKSSDKGVQKCDEFLGPEEARDVHPVDKAATVDKSNVSYDREDERAVSKVLKSRRDAEKRDPNFKRKAKMAKQEAITSPHSPGHEDSDESESDSDDEETCAERVEGVVEAVQECASVCCSMVQKLCMGCVSTCKQYAKVDDEDEDEENDGKRTRPTRAATAPSKMERREV